MSESEIFDHSRRLCHYTTAEAAFAHILPSGRLRMNPYGQMRDPLENQRPFAAGAGAVGNVPDIDERYFAVSRALNSARDHSRLLSLTHRPDDFPAEERPRARAEYHRAPYARPRMWEQYADDHAGVCLLFDREALLDRCTSDEGRYRHGAVIYTTEGYSGSRGARNIDLAEFAPEQAPEFAARHVADNWPDFFLTKTLDWAAEHEYRIVFEPTAAGADGDAPAFLEFGEALQGVLLGVKFPDWQIPAAVEAANRAGAFVRQMTWGAGMPYPALVRRKGEPVGRVTIEGQDPIDIFDPAEVDYGP